MVRKGGCFGGVEICSKGAVTVGSLLGSGFLISGNPKFGGVRVLELDASLECSSRLYFGGNEKAGVLWSDVSVVSVVVIDIIRLKL
jgi:hypothetical protein